ncbi:MAG TPA: hypothetical protein PKL97_05685 [Candidatus Omnitrophota bacterium]|mgnify:CR=1 FL=1|nr:hypothetical protein [Candidatus Omnitrophota bacterium]
MFEMQFTVTASETLKTLGKDPGKKRLVRQIKKTLGFLQTDPRHPSLNTHPYQTIPNPFETGEKVFEAYAQNQASSAYRVFWCYGPGKKQITVIAITPHP